MQVYLVGGAVRDGLLQRPVYERDYVVVGATPEQMEQAGYRPVGRDFPVYLHPDTKQEYALARLERKTGPGYRGFVTYFAPDVTLEQDLQRRDLTINAMARGEDGGLVDPYGGQRDLDARLLRHVSPAFVEDPVRILRVARFAARFAPLGFQIAPETLALMREMVHKGEVDALVPERVWRETERSLAEPSPETFFDTLDGCGALPVIMPPLRWSERERSALRRSVQRSAEPSVRFAGLLAALDETAIERLCERLRAPLEYRELALVTTRLVSQANAGGQPLSAEQLLATLERNDAFRRRERFERALVAAGALIDVDANLPAALAQVSAVTLSPGEREGLKGAEIATALRTKRIRALERMLAMPL